MDATPVQKGKDSRTKGTAVEGQTPSGSGQAKISGAFRENEHEELQSKTRLCATFSTYRITRAFLCGVWSRRADQQSGVRNVKVGIRVMIVVQARHIPARPVRRCTILQQNKNPW
jgi:hypothetical protein